MSLDGFEEIKQKHPGHPICRLKAEGALVIMYDQQGSDNGMTFAEFEMSLIKAGWKPDGDWMVVSKERFNMLGARLCESEAKP